MSETQRSLTITCCLLIFCTPKDEEINAWDEENWTEEWEDLNSKKADVSASKPASDSHIFTNLVLSG